MDCVQENRKIYTESFEKYGDDTKSCLWDRPMIMRYEELYKVGELNHSTILDIGCGLGGLYEYFRDDCNVRNMTYKGIDIIDGMIQTAAGKFPEADFEVRDIMTNPLTEKQGYDYVFLCGIFNRSMETDFMKKMLKEAFSYCKKAMAFNFISTYVNFTSEENSYHNPQEIFSYCVENLSRKVSLNHHYAKTDCAVFVYREDL
ncbi:MAG: class I SAM-dependent methyltransferase [Lachnospiraceae bacterium]|nr:class I SAM-dependent methyltransferase [Lachnospiraceae bacterium]